MTTTRPRSIFVNLAVRDLQKSMDFFRALGFSFDRGSPITTPAA
jgi:predicted lactoylglutathione lyase